MSELSVEVEKMRHALLMKEFSDIPPIQRQDITTHDQKKFLLFLQREYAWIGRYIDYRQNREFGLQPLDPLGSSWGENDNLRQLLRLKGNWYFAQLQLIIAGWDVIKAKALQEKIDFPFTHPRAMFASILVEDSLDQFQPALEPGTNSGKRLVDVRREWQRESRFLRSYDRSPESDLFLEELKKRGWTGFWLYAIWDKRDSRDFEYPRQVWREFLNAHKSLTKAAKQRGEDAAGYRVFTLTWNVGRAVVSDRGRPVEWKVP